MMDDEKKIHRETNEISGLYLDYYNLEQKPFQISTDPEFLWKGEKHKEALATFRYGIMDNRGFLLVTGDVGTGKTTLINALLLSIKDEVVYASISDPGLSPLEFYNLIGKQLGAKARFQTKGTFLDYFSQFLHHAHSIGKKVLLIIDEAQRISSELLEEVRLLSNIETQKEKLVNIFFVGQSEFNSILLRPENRALRQRISLNYNLENLSEEEVAQYVRHRLNVAGTKRKIFESSAIKEIYKFSDGYPRLINIICDHALLSGFVKGEERIDKRIILECARELRIPNYRKNIVKNKIKARYMKNAFVAVSILGVLLITAFSYSGRGNGNERILNYLNAKLDSMFVGYDQKNKDVKQDSSENINKYYSDIQDVPGNQNEKAVYGESIPETDKSSIVNQSSEVYVLPEKIIIRFKINSNDLTETGYDELINVAEIMKGATHINAKIIGYTDSSGGQAYNKQLSEFRANIVKSFLIGQGISPNRLQAAGMGMENPIQSNETAEGRNANRRVEINFLEAWS